MRDFLSLLYKLIWEFYIKLAKIKWKKLKRPGKKLTCQQICQIWMPPVFFSLEYAGELCIIALRRRIKKLHHTCTLKHPPTHSLLINRNTRNRNFNQTNLNGHSNDHKTPFVLFWKELTTLQRRWYLATCLAGENAWLTMVAEDTSEGLQE